MRKTINTKKAPAPLGPYNQAILAGNILFTSGQIAIDEEGDAFVSEGIKEETKKVMENLREVLAEAGMDFSHVVKASIFLSSMDYFLEVNDAYGKYFSDLDSAPAREAVEVSQLPKNANVEISLIAVKTE